MRSTSRLAEPWRRLPHPVRWVLAAGVGGILVLVGLVFMVLPGPGLPIVLLGLVVLASEFAWAEVLVHRIKRRGNKAGAFVKSAARRMRGGSTPTIAS